MNTKSKLTRSFATLALALGLGFATLTVGVPTAEAGGCRQRQHHRVQVYKVRTVEVCRHQRFEWRHYSCGRPYKAFYWVVTYKDFYSNGSWKTYDVTVWA